MPIAWRRATLNDAEPCLAIQPALRGDALVGAGAALDAWKQAFRDPFFHSAVLEANPAIRGHGLIGFGASVFVTRAFANAELGDPRPDINSRVIASLHSGQSVLATRADVARANAGEGVDVLVMGGVWRDAILSAEERGEVQTFLASSFTEVHAGYRIRRIIHETVDEPAREFAERSVVYRAIAQFSDVGRVIHLMTAESVRMVPASLGNVIFSFREPDLRLRESDQELLCSALRGATDQQAADGLGITISAVKARWRSTFARIAETMPGLLSDAGDDLGGNTGSSGGRGTQKRHRILAWVRSHPAELRPYDWSMKYDWAGAPRSQHRDMKSGSPN